MTMDYSRVEKYLLKRLRQELSRKFCYHRLEHSIHVIRNVEIIGRAEGVKGDDLLLLKTAALLHDTGFLQSPDQHEALGCRIAETILPDYAYTPEQIKLISAMIMATAIPQKPVSLLQEIICDADLSYLGTDNAVIESENLRREIMLAQKGTFSDIEWIDFQLNFLESHKYFTTYAREHIGTGKAQYVKFLLTEKQKQEEENGKISK